MIPEYPSATSKWLLLLLPLLGLIKINLIGELFLGEPLIFVIAGLYLVQGNLSLRNSILRPLLLIGVLWLFAQMVTDLIVGTPVDDQLRGFAKILFFLVEIFVLDRLLVSEADFFAFFCGLTIAFFIRPFLDFGTENSIGESSGFNLMWKFGIGFATFLALATPALWNMLLTGERSRSMNSIAIAAIAVGCASFYFNSRSLAGILIVTGVMMIAMRRFSSHPHDKPPIFALMMMLFVLAQCISFAYSAGASSGLFGEEAQSKYEQQYSKASSGFLDLIGGGRSEFLVASEAIKDSPILGHGSWARDYKYTDLYIDLLRKKANQFEIGGDPNIFTGLIPSHSHLLGAWVESGIVGAFFWMSVLALILFRTVPLSIQLGGFMPTVAVIFVPMTLWNIAFSPFGGHVRLTMAFLVVLFARAASTTSVPEKWKTTNA